MKALDSQLNGSKKIVFFDFEGTQYTQEIFAIGAIMVTLDNKSQIKSRSKPFRVIVNSYGEVGKIVEDLTNINDEIVNTEGISFEKAINKFSKYVGKLSGIKFISYGNFDLRLLHVSAELNDMQEDKFIKYIFNNYFDYSTFLSRYVKSSKNSQLSLIDALKVFQITPEGEEHDPQYDSINLALLYEAVLKEKRILKDEYKKVLLRNPKLPIPILKCVKKLRNNESVTPDDFESFIEEDI